MSLSVSEKPPVPPLKSVSTNKKPETFPEKVWGMLACFRSVHLAIVLIGLLAAATLVGVFMPQEGTTDLLEIKRQFGANYRIYKAMGLFSVYSSYWFIALEVLFFLNLLCGSFQWLKPAFLAATRQTFCGPEHIQASPHRLAFTAAESTESVVQTLAKCLKSAHYRITAAPARPDGTVCLYASKGNFSRLGPATAHFGILLLLIASVYGSFYGFKAQKLAVPGDTFRIQDSQMFKPNVDESIWQGKVPDWQVRVNDFHIDYYPEGASPDRNTVVKQYYADLSILQNGHEQKRERISVNHPLSMGDTTIYQASFQPTGKLFVEINGKPRKIEVNTQFMGRQVSFTELGNGKVLMVFPFFVQQDPNVTRNYAVFFLRDDHGFIGQRPGKMPPNLRLLEGRSGTLDGMTFKFIKPEIATGLQIKKGPEVPLMYLAYIIVILGTVMCIFSQRRIWLAVSGQPDGTQRVQLLYKTNKARLSFMKELQRLQRDLQARWQTNPGDRPHEHA